MDLFADISGTLVELEQPGRHYRYFGYLNHLSQISIGVFTNDHMNEFSIFASWLAEAGVFLSVCARTHETRTGGTRDGGHGVVHLRSQQSIRSKIPIDSFNHCKACVFAKWLAG